MYRQPPRQSLRRRLMSLSPLLVVALLLAPLAGCQNSQHDENVDSANNRWLGLRSNMMLKMANQRFDTGDLDQAEHTVDDALELDPRNAKLHVLKGRIALERNELERAFQMFDVAKEMNEENAEAHYYQGVILQRWQRYEQAEEAYRLAYEKQSDEPAYLLALSEMMIERDQSDAALELLESKLDYFDQHAALRAQIGYLYKLKNRPAKAADYFEEAALMNPDVPKLREELAMAQLASGDNEQAVETFESLLAMPEMEHRRDLHRTMASAYLEIGRTGKAREIYLNLARSEYGQPSDWLRLGELTWKDGDLGGTLQAANRVIKLAPQRYEGYLLAGMVWHKRHRLEDALTMFDRAAQHGPDRSEPLIMRGLSLQQAGRTSAARDAYREALQRNPGDARAQRLLQRLDSKNTLSAGSR